jgi:5-formyltetrahydrofolate cyclo-ligase
VALPSVILVPLLAFDAEGWRLGYGAGYYDRTLAELRRRLLNARPLAVGIAYAAQEMTSLPHHAGDQRLDGVVTERAARWFS